MFFFILGGARTSPQDAKRQSDASIDLKILVLCFDSNPKVTFPKALITRAPPTVYTCTHGSDSGRSSSSRGCLMPSVLPSLSDLTDRDSHTPVQGKRIQKAPGGHPRAACRMTAAPPAVKATHSSQPIPSAFLSRKQGRERLKTRNSGPVPLQYNGYARTPKDLKITCPR